MSDPSYSSTPYNPDRLIAGDFPHATIDGPLIDNQSVGALSRGAVLGFSGGNWAVVHQTGSFGAATAKGILAKDADPSGGGVSAVIYVTGEFNEDRLSFGGTLDADDVRSFLQDFNIYLRKPVAA